MNQMNLHLSQFDESAISKILIDNPELTTRQQAIKKALAEYMHTREQGNGKTARLERIESKIDKLLGD